LQCLQIESIQLISRHQRVMHVNDHQSLPVRIAHLLCTIGRRQQPNAAAQLGHSRAGFVNQGKQNLHHTALPVLCDRNRMLAYEHAQLTG
jgi:hypothetical protein